MYFINVYAVVLLRLVNYLEREWKISHHYSFNPFMKILCDSEPLKFLCLDVILQFLCVSANKMTGRV